MKQKDAIVLIFAALITRELWIFTRFTAFEGTVLTPYPFSDVQITFDTYLYFACFYISMLMFAWAFVILMPEQWLILESWFAIQIAELIDYFLTYNSPWLHIGSLGVSITLVKFVVLASLIIYSWMRQ